MDFQFIRLLVRFLFLFLLLSTLSLPHRSKSAAFSYYLLIDSLGCVPDDLINKQVMGQCQYGKEKTLAMIKPDGIAGNYTDVVKKAILDFGFSITKEMLLELNEETVQSFYAEHTTKSFFPSLVRYMTSGPVLIMVLEKVNAIADWRTLIGPTDAKNAKVTHPNSIRAMCGLDLQRNCVHGSDSPQSADREINFFFNEASSGYVSRHDEL